MRSLLVLVLLSTGCAHVSAPSPRPPDWLGSGSGAFASGEERRLVGLGAARPEGDPRLAAERAGARARVELARLVDELVDGVTARAAGLAPHTAELRALAQHEVDQGEPWLGPDGNVYVASTLRLERLSKGLGRSGELTGELAERAAQALPEAFASLQRQGVRPVSLPRAATAAAEAATDVGPSTPDSGLCLVRLDAAPGRTNTVSCITDDRVAHWQGVLRYPCGGGEAEAVFGSARFTGSVKDGAVDLTLRGTFHFNDGCTWEHEQHLEGDLGTGVLRYRYRESAAGGQAGCEDACEVDREVRVQR